MTTIDNLAQAKETVEALSDFLRRFDQTLGVLDALKGHAQPKPVTPRISTLPKRESVLPSRTPRPEAMPERILKILETAGRPLTVAEMVDYHQELGWPVADRQALRKQIFASAYYLAKKKGSLTNSEGQYSITPQDSTPA
jgi:hypothetical protein